MQDILPVHELDSLAYLPHEHRACALSQHEVLINDALEQLSASNTEKEVLILQVYKINIK